MNTTNAIGTILGGLALLVLAAAILGYPTMLLWNYCLVPAVDGTHEIGFLQAIGLNFLFSILFKASAKSETK
jgi:hypothetical protein